MSNNSSPQAAAPEQVDSTMSPAQRVVAASPVDLWADLLYWQKVKGTSGGSTWGG